MGRQLISKRIIILATLTLAPMLYYYRCIFFHKKLDNTDITVMSQGYIGEEKDLGGGVWEHRRPFIYIGVKNVCRDLSDQYKDFLPKIAASISDTTREKLYIYFIMYDEKTAFRVNYLAAYRLEEEIPDELLLEQYWACGKEPEFTRWYVRDLKSLNTEVPDILHLGDTRVEQVK